MNEFGGLFAKMPVYSGLAIGIFFAGLGLPGLCGFIGEVLVVLSVWNYSKALAVIAAAVVILTAGYILWAIQRVYLGAEYKGPHAEALTPITLRELAIAAPLLALAILLRRLSDGTVEVHAAVDRPDGRRTGRLDEGERAGEAAKAAAPATASDDQQPDAIEALTTENTEAIENDEFLMTNVGGLRHSSFGEFVIFRLCGDIFRTLGNR